MDRDYFIKLTIGVYRVTELFPEKEPLRYKIRDKANDILVDLISTNPDITSHKQEAIRNIKILDIYFTVAESQNWVNSLNFLFLKKEYNRIKDELLNQISVQDKLDKNKGELSFYPKFLQDTTKEKKISELSVRQKKIIEILKTKDKIQVQGLQEFFPGISKRTLRRDLRNLLKQKMVKRIGKNNMVFYTSNLANY